jgi:chromosomal replication initiator protein
VSPQDTEAETLWNRCSAALQTQISEGVWATWFSSARAIELDEDVLGLAVPSKITKDRIESRYLGLLLDALTDVGAPDVEIRLDIRPDLTGEEIDPLDDGPTEGARPSPEPAPRPDPLDELELSPEVGPDPTPRAAEHVSAALNPRYTFDAFVIGSSNRFAHAAALSVAEKPGEAYNPLFVYGYAGLGKTHLLQAIAHYSRVNYPAFRVRYVSTETFMNEYVDSLRTGEPLAFKRRYRETDILLIDDIQFMDGKEGLQDEFFHTFNTLHGANRQLVLSSDRPPDSIDTLEERLRSRFKMGLITDIQPPNFETRLAILQNKAESLHRRNGVRPESADIPLAVLEFIATQITNNIRELEGALTRVSAFQSLNDEPLTVEVAEHVLRDIIGSDDPPPITPKLILDVTATKFGLDIEEIIGKSRRRPLVTARQIAMYVMRELTDLSYPAIAREFGGRDHTTVMHAVEKISNLMKDRRQIYDDVTDLMQKLRSGTRSR